MRFRVNVPRKVCMIMLIILLGVIIIIGGILLKIVKLSTWLAGGCEVHGVDVSHYQGDIDWVVLQNQDMDFAYIKATEGSSSVDEAFAENWEEAAQTSLKIGAYHFFSFDSEGETQAENYIQTVGTLEGKLIPVVDVEYYGDKMENPPAKEQVILELTDMLQVLEQEYGVKPMIYTTYAVYYKYLDGEFSDYPLWIRDVYLTPELLLNRQWTLWQYSDTAILDGYAGVERYIDKNVFAGNREALDKLLLSQNDLK
ncbi:MAG: glycosyl hydrolase family 25 [Lachnospiraceae bacterium]|nr:glycosyl hydrolase family 25 [Lachnospiraceae bacterium]